MIVQINTLPDGNPTLATQIIGKNLVFLFVPTQFRPLLLRTQPTHRRHLQLIPHIRLLPSALAICIVVFTRTRPKTAHIPAIRFGVRRTTLTAMREVKPDPQKVWMDLLLAPRAVAKEDTM